MSWTTPKSISAINHLPTTSTQRDILHTLAIFSKTYLEVGVQEGNSLEHVLRSAKGYINSIALCDTWGSVSGGTDRGNHDHIQSLLTRLNYTGKVKWLDGDSRELLPKLKYETIFDLIHIDGGHSEEVCYSDLINTWPLCAGFLAVHDTKMEGVGKALYKFLSEDGTYKICRFFIGGHGTAVVMR